MSETKRVLSETKIPVWSYYYGSRNNDRYIYASVTEIMSQKECTYEVYIDEIKTVSKSKKLSLDLYKDSVTKLTEKHA